MTPVTVIALIMADVASWAVNVAVLVAVALLGHTVLRLDTAVTTIKASARVLDVAIHTSNVAETRDAVLLVLTAL